MEKQEEQVEEKAKGLSISLLIVIALLISLVAVFGFITDEIVLEKETGFDTYIYQLLSHITNPTLSRIMAFFTFFGSRTFLLPAYTIIVIYYLFLKKSSSNSIGIAAVALSGAGVLFLFKNIFKRERPLQPLIEKATSFSYPSGHSFSAFTFCGIIIYLIWLTNIKNSWKWFWSILLFLFASTIAISRVYLHMHFASDIIAGFCLSVVWLSICYFMLTRLNIAGKRKIR